MPGPSSVARRADSVVTLVRWVKSLRELGCEPFSGEEDAAKDKEIYGSDCRASRASSGLCYTAVI
jgi:hypothetical protein